MLMNRVLQPFSILNKLKAKERLIEGARFPRAPTESIPHIATAPSNSSLSPFQQFLITNKAMERPFTGNLWDEAGPGFYHCYVCDSRLFTFNHKFKSQVGYPSFWRAIDGTVNTLEE